MTLVPEMTTSQDNIIAPLSNVAPFVQCDLAHNGIHVPTNGSLIFLNNRGYHSVNEYMSQFLSSYKYLLSKYTIILKNTLISNSTNSSVHIQKHFSPK